MLTQDQKQALFTKAVQATIAQGEPCRSPHGGYSYQGFRDGKELRCAIGWLMEEKDLVHSAFIGGLVERGTVTTLGGIQVFPQDGEWLEFLQGLHDGAARASGGFLPAFKAKARDFARRWGLSLDGLDLSEEVAA